MRWLTLVLVVVIAMVAFGQEAKAVKLIETGWDITDPGYVRAHIREMEKLPFDGVVMRAFGEEQGRKVELWRCFTKQAQAWEAYKQPLEDLKATEFRKFRDNFLLVWATSGDCDWFKDAECAAFAHNMGLMARLAKEGGLKGICFDPECYGKWRPWEYEKQPDKDKIGYGEYCAKVRERGREVMRAVAAEYPGLTWFTYFGFSAVQRSMGKGPGLQERLKKDWMSLYPAFLNGLFDEMPEGMKFVDGHEWGYYYTKREQFADAYHLMLGGVRPLLLPGNWEKYRAHVSAGFGLWVDRVTGNGKWYMEDVERNFYTPEDFAEHLKWAKEYSDEYVWIYSQRLNWWKGKVPKEYLEVVEQAQRGEL